MESDGEDVGVLAGVVVPEGCGAEPPPRLLIVVPDSRELEIGCPRASSLTKMTAMAARKPPPAAIRTGFHRIRCHTDS